MSGVRTRHPERALAEHSESSLTPGAGPVNFAFGKEALLTLYTTIRGPEQQAVIDYIFRDAKRRNAGIFTTSHVLAEVIGTVRQKRSADAVETFLRDIGASKTYVLHGARPWENPTSGIGEKAISERVRDLYITWDSIDFKFHEGTLVLDAVRLHAERISEEVYVISFDGRLTNLAWNEGLNVLPTETSYRNDDI